MLCTNVKHFARRERERAGRGRFCYQQLNWKLESHFLSTFNEFHTGSRRHGPLSLYSKREYMIYILHMMVVVILDVYSFIDSFGNYYLFVLFVALRENE